MFTWISTHALLAEGDFNVHFFTPLFHVFQPTPSSRRATQRRRRWPAAAGFQPTPSSRRATVGAVRPHYEDEFQPTPSSRRATVCPEPLDLVGQISTHALLAEGDRHWGSGEPASADFNPRPPRGGRPGRDGSPARPEEFQPTPSSRRATGQGSDVGIPAEISTHALLAEGDPDGDGVRGQARLFQPTPSSRRATHRAHRPGGRRNISTHALLAEGDVVTPDETAWEA